MSQEIETILDALDKAVTWLDDASAAAQEAGLTEEHDEIEAVWSDAERLHSELKERHES